MRYSASEKYEIIRLVEDSNLSIRQTLTRLDIHRSTFYHWLQRYQDNGVDGLEDRKPTPTVAWNQIPLDHRDAIIELALDKPELSPRELAARYTDQQAYFVSESTVYRLLKAQDLITSPAYILMQAGDTFQHPSKRVNELWQTDFTYFKIIGWGWYYMSTVLDDALCFTGLDQVKVRHKPRLLSDNGPCYISGELSGYLQENGMTHTRGRPYHPQTQGKIERWHRSMKNQILLNNSYLPAELQEHLQRFISYYNHQRYHESLDNLTPAECIMDGGRKYWTKGIPLNWTPWPCAE